MMHQLARTTYDVQADTYEASRPSYPPAAITHCLRLLLRACASECVAACTGTETSPEQLPTPSRRFKVLDLAAGTGKLTRQLAAVPWLDVEAAEPSAGMQATFRRCLPGITLHAASAASLPVADGTYDAVFIAQAFHWFASEGALSEIVRVIAPGGALLMMWNMEDGGEAWVRQYRDVYEYLDASIPQYRRAHWRAVFRTPLAHTLFTPLPDLQASTPPPPQPAAASPCTAVPPAQAHSGTGGGTVSGTAGFDFLGERDAAVLARSFPSPEYEIGEELGHLLGTRFFMGAPDMVTPDTVWRRMLSKSYVGTRPAELIAQLRANLVSVLRAHAHLFAAPGGSEVKAGGGGTTGVVGGAQGAGQKETDGEGEESVAGAAGIPPNWVAPLPTQTEVCWAFKRKGDV